MWRNGRRVRLKIEYRKVWRFKSSHWHRGMNSQTVQFFEELKLRQDVVGIILFGSWARGNNREGSDVDLVVITENEYKRSVEFRGGQMFEIIFTTPEKAFDFWKNNKDDAYGLWSVAKIIFDRDGSIEVLKDKTLKILQEGKRKISESEIEQNYFDAKDQVEYAQVVYKSDPTTANMILLNKVFVLIESYFNYKQLWIPVPKQRIAELHNLDTNIAYLIKEFYKETNHFSQKVDLAKRIIAYIYGK